MLALSHVEASHRQIREPQARESASRTPGAQGRRHSRDALPRDDRSTRRPATPRRSVINVCGQVRGGAAHFSSKKLGSLIACCYFACLVAELVEMPAADDHFDFGCGLLMSVALFGGIALQSEMLSVPQLGDCIVSHDTVPLHMRTTNALFRWWQGDGQNLAGASYFACRPKPIGQRENPKRGVGQRDRNKR